MTRRLVSRAIWAIVVTSAVLLVARYGPDYRQQRLEVRIRIPSSGDPIRAAINGLDLKRAKTLLSQYPTSHSDAALLRARLALYQGECDEARAILGPNVNVQPDSGRELSSVAEGCARAMAGARVINDEKRSVWVRLQDDADAAWTPLILDTADRARNFVAARLGVRTDLPLRIELVMDHASLSAITGLPLEAAETTGTVAVARFGRVTLLSPRAFKRGYPWQDTLAHEITHLLVTAATNDNAPLWLQEGLAKHLESSWRPARPRDGIPDPHEIARSAWARGQAIGFERLGSSIALLPNPEAASIAYAEVFDFVDLLIRQADWVALKLLLRELRVLGTEGTDAALRSVTGYSLNEWTQRWRHDLAGERQASSRAVAAGGTDSLQEGYEDIARRARLAELFASLGLYQAVEGTLSAPLLDKYPIAELRSLLGLSLLARRAANEALLAIGEATEVTNIYGEWLALRGRALAETGQRMAAGEHFGWALGYAPTDERVACQGYTASKSDPGGDIDDPLCSAARKWAASASEPVK